MTELLRLEGVSVDFHVRRGFFATTAVRAVRDVSLTLERGEHVAVVGESGSGKTTLGRATLRLVPAAAGRVLFDGTDIGTLKGAELLRVPAARPDRVPGPVQQPQPLHARPGPGRGAARGPRSGAAVGAGGTRAGRAGGGPPLARRRSS